VFVCTALAYIFVFSSVANIGFTKAITVAYLVTGICVLLGMIFLAEQLKLGMWGGWQALVICSVLPLHIKG